LQKIKTDSGIVNDFKVSCVRMRKVSEHIRLLIENGFKNKELDSRKEQYISIFNLFNEISNTLRSNEDFDEVAINKVQIQMDEFFRNYIEMFGHDAVTNYIHLWGSGHLRKIIIYIY